MTEAAESPQNLLAHAVLHAAIVSFLNSLLLSLYSPDMRLGYMHLATSE